MTVNEKGFHEFTDVDKKFLNNLYGINRVMLPLALSKSRDAIDFDKEVARIIYTFNQVMEYESEI